MCTYSAYFPFSSNYCLFVILLKLLVSNFELIFGSCHGLLGLSRLSELMWFVDMLWRHFGVQQWNVAKNLRFSRGLSVIETLSASINVAYKSGKLWSNYLALRLELRCLRRKNITNTCVCLLTVAGRAVSTTIVVLHAVVSWDSELDATCPYVFRFRYLYCTPNEGRSQTFNKHRFV